MPIYDYHCDHCGHTFSAVQSYTDSTLDICPSCGKTPRKLMATPAIVFKGGGWYKTDSRPTPKDGSKDHPKDGSKESKDGPKEGSKESGDTAVKDPTTKKTEKAEKAEKAETAKADTPKGESSPPADPKAASKAAPKGEAASS